MEPRGHIGESPADESNSYDEEKVDAAKDLIRLMGKARSSVAYAREARERGDGDPLPELGAMRNRVSETILEDCLLFDESTTLALFDFASTWRGAAYECDPDKTQAADARFDRSYRRAVELLGAQLATASPRPHSAQTGA